MDGDKTLVAGATLVTPQGDGILSQSHTLVADHSLVSPDIISTDETFNLQSTKIAADDDNTCKLNTFGDDTLVAQDDTLVAQDDTLVAQVEETQINLDTSTSDDTLIPGQEPSFSTQSSDARVNFKISVDEAIRDNINMKNNSSSAPVSARIVTFSSSQEIDKELSRPVSAPQLFKLTPELFTQKHENDIDDTSRDASMEDPDLTDESFSRIHHNQLLLQVQQSRQFTIGGCNPKRPTLSRTAGSSAVGSSISASLNSQNRKSAQQGTSLDECLGECHKVMADLRLAITDLVTSIAQQETNISIPKTKALVDNICDGSSQRLESQIRLLHEKLGKSLPSSTETQCT